MAQLKTTNVYGDLHVSGEITQSGSKVYHEGNFDPDSKQDKLTAGTNVTISGNTISAVNTTYTTGTLAQLNTGTDTTGQLQSAKLLNDWIDSKNYVTTDTKYTAGNGLTLTGTSFSLPVTVSGSGSYVQSVTQGTNGIEVTLGTPPNTTYTTGTLAQLNTGTDTTGRLQTAKNLSDWLNNKGYVTTDTKYTAGSGLSLTGTEFSLPVTVTGSGSFVKGVTQTDTGINVELGTPPDTNTTYSTGTLAQLNTGTDTTGRLHTAKNLNDWIDGKGYVTTDTKYTTSTLAQLTEGVDTTGRLHSAKNLNEWLKNTRGASVIEYGAKGDGVSDDTLAFKRAISENTFIIIPKGRYKLSSNLEIKNKDFSLVGHGKDISILEWVNDDGGILLYDDRGFNSEIRATFSIEGLTFSTRSESGGTAIKTVMSTPSSTVLGDATTLSLKNVDIRGKDQYSSNTNKWTTGVHLVDTGACYLSNIRVLGANSTKDTTGIIIESNTATTFRYFLDGIQLNFLENGINLIANQENTLEGVYMNNFEIVATMVGVNILGGSLHALSFSNGHFDCDTESIKVHDSASTSTALSVYGNYIQRSDKAKGSAISGYVMNLNGVSQSRIFGNYLLGDTSVEHFGININGGKNNLVFGNSFMNLNGIGVNIEESSVDCKAYGNTFNNVNMHYNILGLTNTQDGSGVGYFNSSNNAKTVSGSVIVNLDSTGSAFVNFSSPFKNRVDSVVVTNGDISNIHTSVGSTLHKGNLSRFYIATNPPLPNTNIRINYIAVGT